MALILEDALFYNDKAENKIIVVLEHQKKNSQTKYVRLRYLKKSESGERSETYKKKKLWKLLLDMTLESILPNFFLRKMKIFPFLVVKGPFK